MIIRTATAADAERIQRIYATYVEDTAISFEYEVPSIQEMERRIVNTLVKYPYLVAEEDGQILGYAYAGVFKGRAAYDHCVETTLYISSEHKGKGLGRRLYNELELRLNEMGIKNLYACIAVCSVEDEHLTNASWHFHEHMGYKLAGRFHNCGYKFGKMYDMIWMEKFITGSQVRIEEKYQKSIEAENRIYRSMKEQVSVPKDGSTGIEGLDRAVDWLCDGSESVLDFGCGNGTLIFLCAKRGVKKLRGIDLASEGIDLASARADMMDMGQYAFNVGSLERLQQIENEGFGSIIISNVLDNMYPEDGRRLLEECHRILVPGGKLLIKLNQYFSQEKIAEYNLKELQPEVYDNGFILWNRTTEEWIEEFQGRYEVVEQYNVFMQDTNSENRVILIRK